MPQQQSPWLEGAYGWNFGEGGWNSGMDSNLLKFSFMFDGNVDGIVNSLPAAVNGSAYFLTTDNRFYFAVGNIWYSSPCPKWFEFKILGTGDFYQFNGTTAVQVDSPAQAAVKFSDIEATLATLGTAAFEDVAFFATKTELDVVEAQAQAYTDTFRTELADDSDPGKGASLIGFNSVTVADELNRLSVGNVINVQDYGAVGDGITSDVDAIRLAILAIPPEGGKLVFPQTSAYYRVTFADIGSSWSRLFKLRSNTTVEFLEGARLKVDGEAPPDHCCIFGFDPTAFPITNVAFIRPNIEGITLGAINTNPMAIGVFAEDASPVGSIDGVSVVGGQFKNVDSSVYAVHRASTSLGLGAMVDRQVRNLKVMNCTALGSVGSFVTADVYGGIVDGCTADGADIALSYDAVSVHSGINIKVTNNTFLRYGLGQVVNVRNSPENGTGSKSVFISGNLIKDCPTVATQISLSAEETTYGVTDITVSNNIYDAVRVAVYATAGAAGAGTPFNGVSIIGNKFSNATERGIAVVCNTSVFLEDSTISNNEGQVTGTTSGEGIIITALRRSTVTNNRVISPNNAAGHTSIKLKDVYYTNFCNNSSWCNDPAQTTVTITTFVDGNIESNDFRGAWSITGMTNTLGSDNHFRNNGTHNGRSISRDWRQFGNKIAIEASAAPVAGTWVVGDTVKNTTPVAGGFIGWVCVTAGTPGTWKGFGTIEA